MVSFFICLVRCGTKEIEEEYTIINEEKFTNIKTMIDVRLKSEVDRETLTKIAFELKNDGRRNYQSIFINYYLPEMEVGKGAWALSHFNPDLEVSILGLTKTEKTQLLKEPSLSESNLIGRWIDNTPHLSGIITISRNANILELSIKYKDGSEAVKKLIERTVSGQKHWIEEGNDFGEYYVLNSDGTLSIYDSEGLIKTMPKVK